MLNEYRDILTPEELMEILNIGQNSLYKLLNSGKLKAFRLGRSWKIPKCAVEEFIYQSVKDKYIKENF